MNKELIENEMTDKSDEELLDIINSQKVEIEKLKTSNIEKDNIIIDHDNEIIKLKRESLKHTSRMETLDYFAGQAVIALLSCNPHMTYNYIAEKAYRSAEYMLKEREKYYE